MPFSASRENPDNQIAKIDHGGVGEGGVLSVGATGPST